MATPEITKRNIPDYSTKRRASRASYGIDVCLIIDRSTSTAPFLSQITEAVKGFVTKLQASVSGEAVSEFYNGVNLLGYEVILNIIEFGTKSQYLVMDKNILDVNPQEIEFHPQGATNIGEALEKGINRAYSSYKERCNSRLLMRHPIVFLFTDGEIDAGTVSENIPRDPQEQEALIKKFFEVKEQLNNLEKQKKISFVCCAYDEGINDYMTNLSLYGRKRVVECTEGDTTKVIEFFRDNIINLIITQTKQSSINDTLNELYSE